MQQTKFNLFVESKTDTKSLNELTGGQGGLGVGHSRIVYCKDYEGENLGSYETDCDDSSFWLSDCRGLFPGTVTAVSVG